jgi:hypothetical protein
MVQVRGPSNDIFAISGYETFLVEHVIGTLQSLYLLPSYLHSRCSTLVNSTVDTLTVS